MSSPRSFPDAWLGEWTVPDGRVLTIGRERERLRVTLRPQRGAAPFSNPSADELPATWMNLGKAGWGLRAEVGAAEGLAGLGPTYDLVFVHDGAGRPATRVDPLSEVRAVPNVMMGLYDDYEDDLGVPWAAPLEPWAPR